MQGLSGVVRRWHHRAGWERHVASVRVRSWMWDALAARSAAPRVERLITRQQLVPLPSPPFAAPGGMARMEQRSASLLQVTALTGPAMIEPRFGYVVAPLAQLLRESLPYSANVRSRWLMRFFSGVPSLGGYVAARRGWRSVRCFPAVASLRHPFDDNYYHALVEVLARIALLEEHGLARDIPLVVSPRLASRPFFRQLTARGDLAHRVWIVQRGFYIAADTVYVPLLVKDDRPSLDRLLELAGVPPADLLAGQEGADGSDRLFLTRGVSAGRLLGNLDQLRPVLQAHRLRLVDTAELSVANQMELFRGARLVAGIHGAGLTNLIFRRGAPLSVLELIPPAIGNASYYLLARSYGYAWEWVPGVPLAPGANHDRAASFAVEPALLDARLAALQAG